MINNLFNNQQNKNNIHFKKTNYSNTGIHRTNECEINNIIFRIYIYYQDLNNDKLNVSIKLKLLNRKMNTTTTTTNNNASPTIFGITMGPLNMVGIFAAGIVGRSILKTFLGGAATPIILLLLAGYVYYLKQKEKEKQEINRNNLNYMSQNISNANRFSSMYGGGSSSTNSSNSIGTGGGISSQNNKMYSNGASNIGFNNNRYNNGLPPSMRMRNMNRNGGKSSSSSYNLSSSPISGDGRSKNKNNINDTFQASLRELDNKMQNRFGPQSGTIKITKKERRRIQGVYDRKFGSQTNNKNNKSGNNSSQKKDDSSVKLAQQENKKERRLYKGRTRKRRNRKLTTTIKFAD